MKCFYHRKDHDGHSSGAMIKLAYPNCEMIGIDYGEEFPFSKIQKDETVFIVDFCIYPFSKMEELNSHCNLIWIDHHQTAIDMSLESSVKIRGLQKNRNIGACVLVWEYLSNLNLNVSYFKNRAMPQALVYLGKYDVKDYTDFDTVYFHYGLERYNTIPSSDNMTIWKRLLLEDDPTYVKKILEEGRLIYDYIFKTTKTIVNSLSFPINFEGLKLLCVNCTYSGSIIIDTTPGIWDMYDAVAVFTRSKDNWKISLYTDKKDIDVSIVCKKHGGGGHKGASGFVCKELPQEFLL